MGTCARQPHAGLVDATDVDSNDLFEAAAANTGANHLHLKQWSSCPDNSASNTIQILKAESLNISISKSI